MIQGIEEKDASLSIVPDILSNYGTVSVYRAYREVEKIGHPHSSVATEASTPNHGSTHTSSMFRKTSRSNMTWQAMERILKNKRSLEGTVVTSDI